MTPAEYEQHPGLNWSTLKLLHTSPLLYRWRLDHPEPDKDAYRVGRAFHCAVLEPDRWRAQYRLQPNFGDLRTTAAKCAKADWLETLPADAIVLPASEYRDVEMAAAAVREHRVARQLLTGGQAEVCVTWSDPETGLACKGRLDLLKPDGVVDLKSAREIGPRRFSRAVGEYLYAAQLVYYWDGCVAAGLLPAESQRPVIVAAEVTEPYDVGVYRLHETAVEAGRRLYRRLLTLWQTCTEANLWPGACPDMLDLVLPPWSPGMQDAEESEVL
jgi:exodeoxyribonuclease VIII